MNWWLKRNGVGESGIKRQKPYVITRSTVERVNARLKDEFGGRVVGVRGRGHAKVMCHLMFGILALTANQMLILVT
jgi:hypothetical protein